MKKTLLIFGLIAVFVAAFIWSLPASFDNDLNPDALIMAYRSVRGLSDLAHGLMVGVIKHYGEPINITVEPVSGTQHVRFHLQKA